jgi:phospholipase C
VGDDGVTYNVDGIDDKLTTIYNQDDEGDKIPLFRLTSTCIDDASSAWLASFGDVNRYDFSTGRSINMDGYVHNAEGYDLSCAAGTSCSGSFTDQYGERAMGYYDQNTLNYYYFMASEYALSDRWFSPVASKSIDNRIATFTGGTTQGLVKDPNGDDKLDTQLGITTIFDELNTANVSWKIYYTVTQGFCVAGDDDCGATGPNKYYPATDYSNLSSSYKYLYVPTSSTAGCTPPTVPSQAVGDSTNSFCIDPTHIAPLVPDYYNDLANGTLPSFAFIEAGYGNNDEHPGSGQPVQAGQAQVAKVINAFTGSTSYADSVFFLAYDEGGGPYDHVPPVPGSSNKYTDPTVGGATTATDIPDIASISVAPDSYAPCVPAGYTTAAPVAPTLHCDLVPGDPGAATTDAAASDEQGFGAQLGFRLPNMVISPFTRRHYVSHIPMDHTAVIKFVESRFINGNKSLTARDAAQPNLLDFFDFNNVPWAVPPTPPAPLTNGTCSAATFGQPVPE